MVFLKCVDFQATFDLWNGRPLANGDALHWVIHWRLPVGQKKIGEDSGPPNSPIKRSHCQEKRKSFFENGFSFSNRLQPLLHTPKLHWKCYGNGENPKEKPKLQLAKFEARQAHALLCRGRISPCFLRTKHPQAPGIVQLRTVKK